MVGLKDRPGKTANFINTFTRLVSSHFKCPICQNLLDQPVILECNHLFCQQCINEWIVVLQSRSDIKSCPVCRKLIRNLVDASDLPSSTLRLFLHKFIRVNHVFRTSPAMPPSDRLHSLVTALDIPYNFKNIEALHNLNSSRLLVKNHRKENVLKILSQLHESENDFLLDRVKPPKTFCQRFGFNFINTCRMLCPTYVHSLREIVQEYTATWTTSRVTEGHWVWTRPKSVFYFWVILTFFYIYIIYLHGANFLSSSSAVKKSVRRLFQHVVFICLDIPTYELVSIIREAFLTPL